MANQPHLAYFMINKYPLTNYADMTLKPISDDGLVIGSYSFLFSSSLISLLLLD